MCKLFALTSTQHLTQAQLQDLIKELKVVMCKQDKDGFGYAVLGEEGMYGERFTDVSNVTVSKAISRVVKVNTNIFELSSNSFGKLSNPKGGLIVHARTSTNALGLHNTHPFVKESMALVHNGIVENLDRDMLIDSDCDTEYVLNHYIKGGMEHVSNKLEGYYACAVIDEEYETTTIFKDSIASLYGCELHKLGCFMFATSQDILMEALDCLEMNEEVFKVKDNTHMIFDVSGTWLATDTFTPMQRSFGAMDEKSLGYSVTEYFDKEEYSWDDTDYYMYMDKDNRQLTKKQYNSLSPKEKQQIMVYDEDYKRVG